jgi:hypothetical protein
MKSLSADLLFSLSVDLPKESIKVLFAGSRLLYDNMNRILTYNSFWKKRTEHLLNVEFNDK